MKIMICGKGGCGKSTFTVLLAKALAAQGKKVLVIDADESNLCLHRLLGTEQPEIMMDSMGGRSGTRTRLKQATDHQHHDEFFQETMRIADLPANCITEVDGIKLLVVGKIKEFGEGCACMIGGISKALLSRLHENNEEIVLIDAEAGLEHFGRQVDRNCDLVLSIVEPSYESVQMADRCKQISQAAGVQTYFVLNKMDKTSQELLAGKLEQDRVIATLPHSDELFTQNLKGEPLTVTIPQLESACSFITSYNKPLSLNMKMQLLLK